MSQKFEERAKNTKKIQLDIFPEGNTYKDK